MCIRDSGGVLYGSREANVATESQVASTARPSALPPCSSIAPEDSTVRDKEPGTSVPKPKALPGPPGPPVTGDTVPPEVIRRKREVATSIAQDANAQRRFKAAGVITVIEGENLTVQAEQPFTGSVTVRIVPETRVERYGVACQTTFAVGQQIGFAALRTDESKVATAEAIGLP